MGNFLGTLALLPARHIRSRPRNRGNSNCSRLATFGSAVKIFIEDCELPLVPNLGQEISSLVVPKTDADEQKDYCEGDFWRAQSDDIGHRFQQKAGTYYEAAWAPGPAVFPNGQRVTLITRYDHSPDSPAAGPLA